MLYAGTGDNHSGPATDTSDSVLAFSIDSGKIVWSRQLTIGDMEMALVTPRTKQIARSPTAPIPIPIPVLRRVLFPWATVSGCWRSGRNQE